MEWSHSAALGILTRKVRCTRGLPLLTWPSVFKTAACVSECFGSGAFVRPGALSNQLLKEHSFGSHPARLFEGFIPRYKSSLDCAASYPVITVGVCTCPLRTLTDERGNKLEKSPSFSFHLLL